MKRTPLKRKTPLRNKAPMKRGRSTPSAKRAPIRAVSKKREELNKQWAEVKARKLREFPVCEFSGCRRNARDVHHKAGRGRHLLTWEYLMSVCREHHDRIHDNCKEAELLGYIVRDRSPFNPPQLPSKPIAPHVR